MTKPTRVGHKSRYCFSQLIYSLNWLDFYLIIISHRTNLSVSTKGFISSNYLRENFELADQLSRHLYTCVLLICPVTTVSRPIRDFKNDAITQVLFTTYTVLSRGGGTSHWKPGSWCFNYGMGHYKLHGQKIRSQNLN